MVTISRLENFISQTFRQLISDFVSGSAKNVKYVLKLLIRCVDQFFVEPLMIGSKSMDETSGKVNFSNQKLLLLCYLKCCLRKKRSKNTNKIISFPCSNL